MGHLLEIMAFSPRFLTEIGISGQISYGGVNGGLA